MMKRILALLPLLALIGAVQAEVYLGANTGSATGAPATPKSTNFGDCSPSTSAIDLDINNIRARIMGGGDMWWDGQNEPIYEFPKIDPASGVTPISCIFAGALWFSGIDDAGNLKVAAQTYRNQGHDFWPGPLLTSGPNRGEVNAGTCAAYDRFFEVFGSEIDEFRAAFEANGGVSLPSANIPANVLNWPGRGNPYLPSNLSYDEGPLAPFFDFNGDGIYDPTQGDYPVIGAGKDTTKVFDQYADQMIFWVINDKGNVHGRTFGQAIGVQVNCIAFAFQAASALNNMTFYSYNIVKRTPGSLSETFMGQFVDPDLGEFTDDYIGCDTMREIGFVYNANANDGEYGNPPPVVAIDYFEGPTNELGEELGLSSFIYFNNAISGPQTDPDNAPQFRNYQTSLWKDGLPIEYGGDGRLEGTFPTNYVYPSNPVLPAGPNVWSECSEGIAPDDRRFLQNSGPFTLFPDEFKRITIGVMSEFPATYSGCQEDIESIIGPADDLAQSLFDTNFDNLDGPDAPNLEIRELDQKLIITLQNPESSNNYAESYEETDAQITSLGTFSDTTYKFQGYQVYQLADAQVTASDLDDPEKATLIFQCDIKDGVDTLYNFFQDGGTGTFASEVQVIGADEGITRSFEVVEDRFAEGNTELVNHTEYNFMAVAYAYNNYRSFIDTVPDAAFQRTQYLIGGNIKPYSAIPHKSTINENGFVLNAEYGDGVPVTRLEGRGNGGFLVGITEAAEDAVLNSPTGLADRLQYAPGAAPIDVQVVDPFSVQNVDFELRFRAFNFFFDTTVPAPGDTVITRVVAEDSLFTADSVSWEVDVIRDGTLVETIPAERPFDRSYEQILEDYGITVGVGSPAPFLTNLDNNAPIYAPISATVEYETPDDVWVDFVVDEEQGAATPSNWIRSGTNAYINSGSTAPPTDFYVYDDHEYPSFITNANEEERRFYDPLNAFDAFLDGRIAPYALGSNYWNPVSGAGSTFNDEPVVQFMYGPAFRWDRASGVALTTSYTSPNQANVAPENNLEDLQSILLVMTPDRSKWSRCVVLETGERQSLTLGGDIDPAGNARKGQIRMSNSLLLAGDQLIENTSEVGRSYFPGYAINLETGERLNVSFGEASDFGLYNGADMIWNPTSNRYNELQDIPGTENSVPIWGGKHYVYVFNTRYDEGERYHRILTDNYNLPTNPAQALPDSVRELYKEILYTAMPLAASGADLSDGVPPSEVRIQVNVERPYGRFETSETFTAEGNQELPRYLFSTDSLGVEEEVQEVAENALDSIRVVPNPYYAYSDYEESQLDNRIKITNLPSECTVGIYTLDGKLVRQFDRAVGSSGAASATRQQISRGNVVGQGSNLDSSLDWDLKNQVGINVGSGVYLIHVDAPGIGEATVKSMVFLRPTDVNNF
mgnify:CR=1 FL=1